MKVEICIFLVGISVVSGHIIIATTHQHIQPCLPGQCDEDIGLHCVYDLAPCYRGTCQCQANYTLTAQTGTCMPDKKLGEVCEVTEQCQASFLKNDYFKRIKSRYSVVSNVECKNKKCTCKLGSRVLTGSSLPFDACTDIPLIGEQCDPYSSMPQCLGFDSTEGFVPKSYVSCNRTSKRCECDKDSAATGTSCTPTNHAKVVGEKCATTRECEHIENAICDSAKCTCPPNMFQRSTTHCDYIYIGDPCAKDADCFGQRYNVTCIGNKCGCRVGFAAHNDNQCFGTETKIGIGEVWENLKHTDTISCLDQDYHQRRCPGDLKYRCLKNGESCLQVSVLLLLFLSLLTFRL